MVLVTDLGFIFSYLGFSAIPHMMMPSAAQATLTSFLLSGVPSYGQNTPSPPPGLTPVDVHMNGMHSEGKKVTSALNGHVKVRLCYCTLIFASSL